MTDRFNLYKLILFKKNSVRARSISQRAFTNLHKAILALRRYAEAFWQTDLVDKILRVGVSFWILFMFLTPVFADSHHPQEFLKAITGSKNEGEQIYNHFCANCHAQKPIIPLGAPRIGNGDDWSIRVKQGINVLFRHTDEGLNAMPPRGGCFECTDDQLLLTILEIVPKRDKKVLLNELLDHKKYK